ncbi:carboxymuconolactone decarboxylase family protein [uncultured Tolumonas sp.]|uniref:carboxymuconolactone decarboxylase family protein n=1 Tax=uncultured Tolumonas sp. TaxID=263765 RepID=UPI00292DBE5A|nr:carboxymuconolactone decarboxylase family protein [uncultured Tolumonas sp.]
MTLNAKDKHLAVISSATAMGNIEPLKTYLASALNDGVTINELKELLVQLYAYCGFPRSLNGLGALYALLESRREQGIQDAEGVTPNALPTDKSRFDLGDAVQQELVGRPVSGPVLTFAPAIDAFLKEHLFADIFLRGVLTYQEREVITIAALASIGVASQLNSHIRIGMNVGLTSEMVASIAEALKQIDESTAAKLIYASLDSLSS